MDLLRFVGRYSLDPLAGFAYQRRARIQGVCADLSTSWLVVPARLSHDYMCRYPEGCLARSENEQTNNLLSTGYIQSMG